MEDFRVTVTGAPEELDELERFCSGRGIMTERGIVSAYDGVAVSGFALHATARLDVLAEGIAAYGAGQQPALRVRYFVPGRGNLIIADYSVATVAEVLRQTQELSFDRPV